jgi:hypothetical protein
VNQAGDLLQQFADDVVLAFHGAPLPEPTKNPIA